MSKFRIVSYCAKCGGAKVPTQRTQTKTPGELEAEFLANAPQSFREMVARHEAREAEEKEALVQSLLTAQDVYTEQELRAEPLAFLERLAIVAKLEPSVMRLNTADDMPPPPPTWGDFVSRTPHERAQAQEKHLASVRRTQRDYNQRARAASKSRALRERRKQ